MNVDRTAAVSLVAGSAAGLVTMVLHPTGQDVIQAAATGGANALVRAVHALALGGQGLLLAGLLQFAAVARRGRQAALLGYVFFALSAVGVILAATASGFVSPAVAREMADDADRWGDYLRFTGMLNQAFAQVNVLFLAPCFLAWAVATWRDAMWPRGLALLAALVGVGMLVAGAPAEPRLDIHGYGLIVLAQSAWFTWLAAVLWRAGAAGRDQPGPAR